MKYESEFLFEELKNELHKPQTNTHGSKWIEFIKEKESESVSH